MLSTPPSSGWFPPEVIVAAGVRISAGMMTTATISTIATTTSTSACRLARMSARRESKAEN
ncbi:hypothetical protein F6W96_08735 [Nocardia terpenica]|uniref:Uncharacterized protein n=1 Tax=Nocardia terpenica TaxID=455432 RepID=A0A6G9YYQ7_9NOCA|nr:hypothetical protein [Nocardia terpenica]QIS18354.1 hypothetical protein F6W96_08735 [Nocardia terpenica]